MSTELGDDDLPSRIEWSSDHDRCIAEVGKPIKWGKPDKKTGTVRAWHYGQTVLRIYNDPTWSVLLDPDEPPSMWHNPLMCGYDVKVSYGTQ